MKKSEPSRAVKWKIDLNGDRRLAENVILEVQAAARRLGLEIANVEVVSQSAPAGKARKPASRRKPERAPEAASRSSPNHCFIPSASSRLRPRSRLSRASPASPCLRCNSAKPSWQCASSGRRPSRTQSTRQPAGNRGSLGFAGSHVVNQTQQKARIGLRAALLVLARELERLRSRQQARVPPRPPGTGPRQAR